MESIRIDGGSDVGQGGKYRVDGMASELKMTIFVHTLDFPNDDGDDDDDGNGDGGCGSRIVERL